MNTKTMNLLSVTNLQQKKNKKIKQIKNLTENRTSIYISSKLLAKFQHRSIGDSFDHEIRIG